MEIVYTADREIIPDSRCPVYPDKISYDAETKTGRFSWKKNIKTVRKGLFDGNGDLLSVVLPPAVAQIAGGAFAGCTALKSVSLPDGLLYIGSKAFSGCRSLTKVSAGSILLIDSNAFAGCTALQTFTAGIIGTVASKAFTACGRFDMKVEGIVTLSDTAFEDSLLNSLSLNAVNPPAIIPTEDEERLNGRFYNENGEEIIPGDEAFTDPDDEDFDFFDDDEPDEEDEEEPGDDGNEDELIPSNDEDDNPFDEPKELPGISFPVFETETEEDSPLPFLPASVTALFIPSEAAAAYRNAPSRKGYRELLRPFSPAERK